MKTTPDRYFDWTPSSRKRNRLLNNYEPIQPYFLSELCRTAGCTIFLDIGANVGFYAIYMASVSGVAAVHAYEPMPRSFEELQRNVALNGMEGIVQARRIALSDRAGTTRMGVIGDLSGANAIVDTTIHAPGKVRRIETVETATLDGQIDLTDARLCLKIDVEGHEAQVIAGAKATLSRNLCVIQIENYEGPVRTGLAEMGYREYFRIGPDFYFSNFPGDLEEARLGIIERSMDRFVRDSKHENAPRRRTGMLPPASALIPRLRALLKR